MKLKKSFQLALNILVHSKLRSWLTILGIVIGIAAVVSIVSISQGAQQQMEEQLGSLGADVLTISPGASRAMGGGGGFRGGFPGGGFGGETSSDNEQKNLTAKDVLVLKNIENVEYVMGQVSGKGDLKYSTKTASLTVTGVDALVWEKITTESLKTGRFLTAGDSYSVILGGNVVERTFEDGIPLNSKVTIEDKTFKVVGILEGGSGVYIPIDVARVILEDVGDKEFDSISVKIADVDIVDDTVELIEKKLMSSRGILNEKDQDFSVSNPSEMQETIQETQEQMSLFLGAIAAISLLVGAIGIANTMFTSVLEKTREIGIMKAIGAKNKDVLLIFLFNSGLIGFVGGVGGVILGIFGSGLISSMSSNGGGMMRMFGNTTLTPTLLIGSLLFSVIIGMLAGAIPAYRASKLSPVDALRYE
jgi:putative ABC transport system permease protein